MAVLGDLLVKILADTKGFDKSVATLESKSKTLGSTLGSIGTSLAGIGAAGTAGLGLLAAQAISFESAFAGVKKTLEASGPEFDRIATAIRDMARDVPTAASELASIAEVGGQLGIKAADIIEFTRVVAELGAATNITGQEGATTLAIFAGITQTPVEGYRELGDVIVDIGNASKTSEAAILSIANRLASAGTLAGIAAVDIIAISASLLSVGVNAEAGGTAFSKLLTIIQTAVAQGGDSLDAFASVAKLSGEDFAKAFKDDAANALTLFLEGLGSLPGGADAVILKLDELGLSEQRLGNAIKATVLQSDEFRLALDRSSGPLKNQNALSKEAAQRFETTASQLRLLLNDVQDLGISLGTGLLPVLKNVVAAVRPFLESISTWIGNNQQLATGITLVAGGLAIFGGALGLGLVALGSIVSAVGTLAPLLTTLLVPALAAARTAVLAAALTLGGPGGLAAGLTALGPIAAAAAAAAAAAFAAWKLGEFLAKNIPLVGKFGDAMADLFIEATKFVGVDLTGQDRALSDLEHTVNGLEADLDKLGVTVDRGDLSLIEYSKALRKAATDATAATAPTDGVKTAIEGVGNVAGPTKEELEKLDEELDRLAEASRALDRDARAASLGVVAFQDKVEGLVLDPVAVIMREISAAMQEVANKGPLVATALSAADTEVLAIAASANDAALKIDLMEAAATDAAENGIKTLGIELPGVVDDIDEVTTATKDDVAAWESWSTQVSTITSDTAKSISDAIVGGNFGDIVKIFSEDLPKAVTRFVTEFLINKLFSALGDLASNILPGIGRLIGKIFGGGGASAASGAASVGGQAASVAGQAAGAAASGVTGIVTGFAQLGAQIFGLFQNAKMETTLNAIEESTRRGTLLLGDRSDGGILGQLFRIGESVSFGPGVKALELLKDKFVFFSDVAIGKLDSWSPHVTSLRSIDANVATIASQLGVPSQEFVFRYEPSGDEVMDVISNRLRFRSATVPI